MFPHATNVFYRSSKALEHSKDLTRIGDGKLYKCPFGSKILDLTDTKEEARDEFHIACLQEGVFEELTEWPKCRKEVKQNKLMPTSTPKQYI